MGSSLGYKVKEAVERGMTGSKETSTTAVFCMTQEGDRAATAAIEAEADEFKSFVRGRVDRIPGVTASGRWGQND